MRELFLDDDTINIGLEQACKKLENMGFNSYTILAIDNGGEQIASRLSKLKGGKDFVKCISKNGEINISNESLLEQKNVLVCDDTTITGKTFNKIYTKLNELNVNDIKFFSMVVRRNSSIVPNLFVFEIEEDTKLYLPWSDYPIRTYSKGIVRKISADDCKKDFCCASEEINKYHLSEFFKNQENIHAKVYLVEDRMEICSIIQFYEKNIGKHRGLFLDIIATAKGKENKKYAGTLIRLLNYYMFYHEFDYIYGYAFNDKKLIEMYKNLGFEVIGSVNDPHYDHLHKIVLVNENKCIKGQIIGAIRSQI